MLNYKRDLRGKIKMEELEQMYPITTVLRKNVFVSFNYNSVNHCFLFNSCYLQLCMQPNGVFFIYSLLGIY